MAELPTLLGKVNAPKTQTVELPPSPAATSK
jgi:hypothetical protein